MEKNYTLCFAFMIPTKKTPSTDMFLAYTPIENINVFPRISLLAFLHRKCASVKILVIFLPAINFALIFMLSLIYHLPWSTPITSSTEMIDSFFTSTHIRRDISKLRRELECLYQKLICSFYIPFSLSYSYVSYSAFMYPDTKLFTSSSGQIVRFPNEYLI